MGLAKEMKNLSEEILNSFKNRIKENTDLVVEVQKTLDGFRKDHMEMAAVLNANAASLRKGLARGEKDRLHTYNELMTGIHRTIVTIQKEVVGIKKSTVNMVNEFAADREQMAEGLQKFFNQDRAGRMKSEKTRIKEFDALMKNINDDIKSINEEVATIFNNTNKMLTRFEKEHLKMSAELSTELSKNLAERVEYTKTLLNGFQKRLAEISKEKQQLAQKLRKDLAKGEVERLNEYNDIMKGIHLAMKAIRKEVKDIQKSTAVMLDDLLQNRVQASAEWNKMHDAMAQIRKNGGKAPQKEVKKVEKKVAKKKTPVVTVKKVPVEIVRETLAKPEPKLAVPMSLEDKVLNYINKHPKGVRIAEMEEPLGETRMKLGFTAKILLDEEKVQKIENVYVPKN